MSRQNRKTAYLQGKLYWFKALPGQLHDNYAEDGKQWAFEFEPDENSTAIIIENGLKDRLKTGEKKDGTMRKNYEGRSPFLVLKRPELKEDGTKNEPIRIVDAANQPWQPKMSIGNETVADVKVSIVDYGTGKFKGLYPLAIRVLEHVQFVQNDFEDLPEDDERVQKAKNELTQFNKDFGLDEDDDEAPVDAAPSDQPEDTQDELDDEVPV